MELFAKVILTKGYIRNIRQGSNVLLSIVTDNYEETKQYIAEVTNSERDSKNSDVSEGNSISRIVRHCICFGNWLLLRKTDLS